ncbi:arylsulfatase [Polaribacter sp.]|uniref:sulfatase family protein n=1 Tax=Polaribacter sp. TaxID=1920175 RepID=UPI0025FF0C4B|nr:arylsulfatase [Polaribacter sp.]
MILVVFISCKTVKETKDEEQTRPNVVIIYADDMGYGDLNCQNPNSKIPTPYLDKLASEGMRFTDAHSSSGICSPSRFALLTGTYHWRNQHEIVKSFGKPFFKETDITLPQVLKTAGYTTACIGKWHLGLDWEFKNPPSLKRKKGRRIIDVYQSHDIDWSKPVKGGPLDRGFDYYFGDGTINFPPYAWMENERFIEAPTEEMSSKNTCITKEGKCEFRAGPKLKDWDPYKVLPTLTTTTVGWINNYDKKEPFFLYFALPSPHAPIIPNDEFEGKSEAGAYGDFMVQTDWVVGQVLNALKEKGLEDNTIVIFSSDNGPEKYAFKRAEKFDHFSMGDFRGLKRDIWEGGHHVPFIVKWPKQIKAGTVSNEVISQVDIMATISSITKTALPKTAGPDSYDFSSILKGKKIKGPLREATVQNTFEDKWALRKGKWLYMNTSDVSHFKVPEFYTKLKNYTDFKTKGLLFDLEADPEQRVNLYSKYPQQVEQMRKLLSTYRTQGYSVKN